MMLGKMEARPNVPRDGRHCDLCGCSQPAVKCDKCGCQIFCLSCDDMYHRHPKRRFHLRKAVDPTPATHMARPVLPMKLSHLPLNSGDPSKMPLPPPRKKKPGKSFFDTFRKKSPSSENSPPLPKKEYSWTDRLGNIKKFMSNRPLPPLPNSNGDDEDEMQEGAQSGKHDMSFIHKRVHERPPQLPQRSMKPVGMSGQENGEVRNGSLHLSQINQNHWDNQSQENFQRNTMHRQPPFGYPGGLSSPENFTNNNMFHSSSTTDLRTLPGMDRPPPQGILPPHYPQYPPHYPYPMYPPGYPNYPPYFGSSFANLPGHQQTMVDGADFSDHSGGSTRNHPNGRRFPFRKKAAKRSQSVLVDRMAFPGQFFPFGPFPPGPWGPAFPMEAPPSPASSIRSLNRIGGRTRRRRKTTSEDEEEDFSMSSSPLSRPKSSSSERPPNISSKRFVPQMTSSDDSEEEVVKERSRSRSRNERVPRKDSDPKKPPSPTVRSPTAVHRKLPKQKKREQQLRHSDNDESDSSPTKSVAAKSPTSLKKGEPEKEEVWIPSSKWQCSHCTYVNPAGKRICQVCCKTASVEGATIMTSRQNSPSTSSRKQSQSSEKSSSSPEKKMAEEEDIGKKKDKQDMEVLNSALDEAEKEISRGLEELMKLKHDLTPNTSETSENKASTSKSTNDTNSSNSKPVYKSSGKMRSNILDKLTLASTKPTATASTSTETQTAQTNSKTDRIIEARRTSNSSTASDAYNSPIAQSPQLDFKRQKQQGSSPSSRKEMSCQTQTDDLMDYLDREEPGIGRPDGFPPRFGDRMELVTSPVSFVYDRGYGNMHRSHSRASLFTGRMNDFGSMDYGIGSPPIYRSVSRSSLAGDIPDGRLAELHNLRKPDYYLSMEELMERRRQESIRAQGQELVRMIREAERQGFTADDIQVALQNCGQQSPMEWLQNNWKKMMDQVIELATKYANNKKDNDIGTISEIEARDALRLHQGNTWAAVTECVESRQRKFFELKARGKFSTKNIIEALTASDGDVELAHSKLSKSSSKPFLMRIWGAGEGVQNQDGSHSIAASKVLKNAQIPKRNNVGNEDALSDDIWDEDEVEWDEDFDEDEEEEHCDLEDLQTCHDDIYISDEVKTPDSDRSDYCDAFGSNTLDRNASLPSSDTFFAQDMRENRKGTGFLSKLAALRKDDKSKSRAQSPLSEEQLGASSNDLKVSAESIEQPKNYNPISVIRNTISAIRDSVGGSSKKVACSTQERRTIVVGDKLKQETVTGDSGNVTLKSLKPIEQDSELSIMTPVETNGARAKQLKPQAISSESNKTSEVTMLNNLQTLINSQETVSVARGMPTKAIQSTAAAHSGGSDRNELVLQIKPLQNQCDSKLHEVSNVNKVTFIQGDKARNGINNKDSAQFEDIKLDFTKRAEEIVKNAVVAHSSEKLISVNYDPSTSGVSSSSAPDAKMSDDKQLTIGVTLEKSKDLTKLALEIKEQEDESPNNASSSNGDNQNKDSNTSKEACVTKVEKVIEDMVLGTLNQVSKSSTLSHLNKLESKDGTISSIHLPEVEDRRVIVSKTAKNSSISQNISCDSVEADNSIAGSTNTDQSNNNIKLIEERNEGNAHKNEIHQQQSANHFPEAKSSKKDPAENDSTALDATKHRKSINSKRNKLQSKQNETVNTATLGQDNENKFVEKTARTSSDMKTASEITSSSESPGETKPSQLEIGAKIEIKKVSLDNKELINENLATPKIANERIVSLVSSEQTANSLKIISPNVNAILEISENIIGNELSIPSSSSKVKTPRAVERSLSPVIENGTTTTKLEQGSSLTALAALKGTTLKEKTVNDLNSSSEFQSMQPIHSSAFNSHSPVQHFTATIKDCVELGAPADKVLGVLEHHTTSESSAGNVGAGSLQDQVHTASEPKVEANLPLPTQSSTLQGTAANDSSNAADESSLAINLINKPSSSSSIDPNNITTVVGDNARSPVTTNDSKVLETAPLKRIGSPSIPGETSGLVAASTSYTTSEEISPKGPIDAKPVQQSRIDEINPEHSTAHIGVDESVDSNTTLPHKSSDIEIVTANKPELIEPQSTTSTEPQPPQSSEVGTDAHQSERIEPQSSTSSEQGTVSDSDDSDNSDSDISLPSPVSRRDSAVDTLRSRFEGLIEENSSVGLIRPASPYRRMSFRSRKEAIALERTRDSSTEKPWFMQKTVVETKKTAPKKSLKQQMEQERKVRKLVADRKCRTYLKAEIVIQLMDLNFSEEEALQAANECSTFKRALSYLQQECLLCAGHFPVSHMISMVHCPHVACRECIRAYFTVQIRDRNIMELLCPFCNEPDIFDEDIAQDYFNHLDIMLKKLVDPDIHELFQRKLRDRVLMRDPNFRWCSQCSSGFIAMSNLKRLVCPDCNAVTCASCRRPWEREHQGITCEAFAQWKDSSDPEAQAAGLAKFLTEDGIACPRCHFRYALAKGGCMHFRCIQCQHDFCSGCSRPFKMGQKCGVSEFCGKLGLHAHHPRNCLFYLRDKDPEDLQRLLDMSGVTYNVDPPDGMEVKTACQVMEQKETADGMVDDFCGKDVEKGFAGLCRLHYVEYLGQLVNKNKVDPIQIFENDDLELVLRRANVRMPPKSYRETDVKFREKLVKVIQEELPLDKMDGS